MPNGYRAVLLTFYVPVGLALYLHTLQHLFGRKKNTQRETTQDRPITLPVAEQRGREGEGEGKNKQTRENARHITEKKRKSWDEEETMK